MAEPRKPIAWEAIEREYRAGQLSVRQIAKQFGVDEKAIRKHAKAEGWVRALADQVRAAVREKLVRSDGSADGPQERRASDAQIIDGASGRGFEVVISQRRDIAQLDALASVIATRLSQVLDGLTPEGPCLGEKESVGDLLEKLSRVKARLIPLQRQAFNLDAEGEGVASTVERSVDEISRSIEGKLARIAA